MGARPPTRASARRSPSPSSTSININYGARSAAGGVTFEKVLRAQLHKNEKYLDELRAEEQLGVAARVVRARYLPGCGPEKPGSMSCEVARAILAAYQAATEGQM